MVARDHMAVDRKIQVVVLFMDMASDRLTSVSPRSAVHGVWPGENLVRIRKCIPHLVATS